MPSPSMKAVMEKWALGLSIDTGRKKHYCRMFHCSTNFAGSDLAPHALPPPSLEIWKALVAGGVAGIVSRSFTAPFEKAKIISQVQSICLLFLSWH